MTIQEICELAEKIAKKYNPENISPFPYEKIQQEEHNLEIFLVKLDEGISGAIGYVLEEKKFNIFINKDKPKTRQNFTIAHELGHYFLHKELITAEKIVIDEEKFLDGTTFLYRKDSPETTKIETEANNFAASLIMPEELVRKAWQALKNVEEIAKIFNVSTIAMSIRLERLGLVV